MLRKMSVGRRGRWIAVAGILAFCAAALIRFQVLAEEKQAPQGPPAAAMAQANGISQVFRSVSERIIPTVVAIKTTVKPKHAASTEGRNPRRVNPFQGTPFEDFFNDRDFPGMPQMPHIQQGMGSGVIIDASGLIITNAHVVADADEVMVQLADGRQFKGTDIKIDEQTDLAVLRIKANGNLPFAKLGDSSKMAIGDWVLAVGHPFELEHTVSAGIISGTKRTLPSGKRAEYLQTDAAINPGNSGGPLVNLDGEVIGINTAIASNNGGYQGVGFAIPSNQAKWVTTQLKDRGEVSRAYLGVAIEDVTADLAAQLGTPVGQGALVNEVYPDTPAAKAGIRDGDVILSFAGEKVTNRSSLQQIVERSPIDSKQKAELLRDGKPVTVSVDVKAMPKKFGVARSAPRLRGSEKEEGAENADLGLSVVDLTAEAAKNLDLKEDSGALISSVEPSGLAAGAGLQPGMAIARVGKTPVRNAADFTAAMKKESVAKGVLLLVRTPQGNRFIVLQKH